MSKNIFAVSVGSVFAAALLAAGGQQEFYTPGQDRAGLDTNSKIIPELPNVLILGDSISIGYTRPVKNLLAGVANVQRPPENCGNTQRGLQKLEEWLGDTQWDVIHFNWGLHDLCFRSRTADGQVLRDKEGGVQDVPLPQYEKNLEELVQRLEKTGAVLIWATTTPVPEGESGRVAGSGLEYNKVAERVMRKHGVRINDLHNLAGGFDPSLWAGPGNVHFKPVGSEKLAGQVVEFIKAGLLRQTSGTALPKILPLDRTNPLIWDNDSNGDVFTLEFVMALASRGDIQLIGITQSPNPYKNRNDDLQAIVDLARASGLKNIPDPHAGLGAYFKTALTRPADGMIDSTIPLDTESARLIRDKVLEVGTPEKPVVIGSGGAYTTVASAYLLALRDGRGNEFHGKSISLGVAGAHFRNGHYSENDYNVVQDSWARYICLKRLRTVSAPMPFPEPEETMVGDFLLSLPPSPLADYMKKKANNLVKRGFPNWLSWAGDDHAVLAMLFPEEGVFFGSSMVVDAAGWGAAVSPERKLNDQAVREIIRVVPVGHGDDIVLNAFDWSMPGDFWRETLCSVMPVVPAGEESEHTVGSRTPKSRRDAADR